MDNDIVNLIYRDGTKKITCFKYMEECYLKQGYISSQNIYANLLYKFFNFKIIRKIRIFFVLFFRCKFFFKDPKQSEFVILDSENTSFVEKIFPNKNYTIISTRIEQINKIYLSKKIIIYIIKNFFKYSVKKNYLTALVLMAAPKVVITHIHDSVEFHFLAKILKTNIKFMAIQVCSPSMFEWIFSKKDKKNFFIPNFFCYGEYDKLFYKKKNVNIKHYEAIGSIKSSLAYEYTKSKKIKINPNKYDICLIGEAFFNIGSDWAHVRNLADSYGLVANFTHRLCKKNNLSLAFVGRVNKIAKYPELENHFYKHHLKDYDFKIIQSPNDDVNEYTSYTHIMQSKLTIALISTMLREAITFDKKILSFNTVDHPDIAFPGPDIPFPQESICVLKEPSYELFEERVLKILSMTNEEYFSQLGIEKSFVMNPTIDTANIMRKKIKEIVEKND